MQEIKLDVQVRTQQGKRGVKVVRREKFIPAVVYGGERSPKATLIKVAKRGYEGIMRHHRGQAVLFHLNVLEGETKVKDYSAILKEEQHDPVSDELIHIDFHRISLTKEIAVKVPLVTKGDAPGVKKSGGSLDHVLWELEVICLPTQIPEKIEVDVSKLEIGDAIHIKELVLPSGVRTKHDVEATVVMVHAPMKEEVLTAEAEAAPIEPEVIREKKPKAEEAAKTDDKAPAKAAKPEAKAPEKK